MTAVCVEATTPRAGPWTVRCSKLLTVRLTVDHSYDRVIKTLRAVLAKLRF